MKELPVEEYLIEQVEAHGGLCIKLAAIARPGFPDRTVMMPWKFVCFVETKAPDVKRLRPHQKLWHKTLHDMGFQVEVINTKEAVDAFVKTLPEFF